MQKTKSKDGTEIAYDVYGSGPALIYVTGASCFRKFLPIMLDAKAFGKEFTVYNYDRRGRGDSGNTLPYNTAREVEDIEAMIDAAGGSAFVYGHSSGAVLALEAAMHLGVDKVKKAVMYDPAYVHDETEKVAYAEMGQHIQKLTGSGQNKEAMKAFLKGIGMPGAFVSLLPAFPGWKTMTALAPTLLYDIALTKDLPPVMRAAKTTVPIQIIVGGKSPAGIHVVANQLTKAIPDATFAEIQGQGHMVSAKVLLPKLVAFFKQ